MTRDNRALATRYAKRASWGHLPPAGDYRALVVIACTLIWLK